LTSVRTDGDAVQVVPAAAGPLLSLTMEMTCTADFFFAMYQGEESKPPMIEDPAPNPPA
jgi:hypothetical protein